MNIDIGAVANSVVTLFFIMLLGIVGRAAGVIDAVATKKLSQLLVKITQPMLIISAMQIDFTPERLNTGLSLIGVSAVVHILSTVAASIIFGKYPQKQAKVLKMATIFGNCAFMGFPILKAIWPEDGLFYGAFYTFFFNIYIWTYGTFMLSRGTGKAYKPLKSVVNVGTVCCLISFLLFIMRIRLPAPLLTAVNDVGGMTFPLAMLIVGSLIGSSGIKKLFCGSIGYYYSILKLVFMPAVTLLIAVIFRFDAGFTAFLVAMTAVPSAANNAIFAEIYDADAPLGARLVGISTLLSVVTLPLMLYITSWVAGLAKL